MGDPVQSLRGLHTLILHPRDRSADELLQQVNRIGCSFEHLWPLPEGVPEKADLVFVDVTDQFPQRLNSLIQSDTNMPAVVAIIGYENPSVLELIFEAGAHSVLMKPIRAAGVLSSMLMARRFCQEQIRSRKEIKKLRDKLDNVHKTSEAKSILMRYRGVTDKEAYDLIRKQAMSKRTTTAEIAQSIINAESILNKI